MHSNCGIISPVTYYNQRIPILDILRGFAISGIIFANILSMSAYPNLPYKLQLSVSSSHLDQWLYNLTDIFIKYKFYTLFSFLFGLGFSILLARAHSHHNFIRTYIVRLTLLFIIGWLHALFFFASDILRMYAIVGLFMILFKDMSDRNLLISSLIALCIPVIIGIFETFKIYHFDPTIFFPYSPKKALIAFQQGPWSDLMSSNYDRALHYLANHLTSRRFFKILGLFLLGFYVGRKHIFHHLQEYLPGIKRILPWAWGISLTTNIIYAQYSANMKPVFRELLYIISVYPLAFTYVITIIYLCRYSKNGKIAQSFSSVGRMSLSNYLAQSILASFFMLWYGFGLAGRLHIAGDYAIGLLIVIVIFMFSYYWMKYFRYGPVEYVMHYHLWPIIKSSR